MGLMLAYLQLSCKLVGAVCEQECMAANNGSVRINKIFLESTQTVKLLTCTFILKGF